MMDIKLENVLFEGTFEGVNEYGHAKIKSSQGEVKEFDYGKMR